MQEPSYLRKISLKNPNIDYTWHSQPCKTFVKQMNDEFKPTLPSILWRHLITNMAHNSSLSANRLDVAEDGQANEHAWHKKPI